MPRFVWCCRPRAEPTPPPPSQNHARTTNRIRADRHAGPPANLLEAPTPSLPSGRGRGRAQDPEGPDAAFGEAGHRARWAGGALRGHEGGGGRPVGGGRAGEARGAPPRDRAQDGLDPRRDEGCGDEARPARVVRRHRVPAARVRGALPGGAREAAHLGPADAVEQGLRGARRGVRRAGLRALRRVRGGGVRRGLDRPGAPGDAARRTRGRGQDPVSGRRRGARVGHAQRGHAGAARAGARAGPRREGGRPGAARAGDGGARLRVRGAEPAQLLARLSRPSVHLRPRRDHPPLTPPGAGHRVRRGDPVRRDQAARRRGAQPLRRDRVPLLLRLDLPPAALQRRRASRATTS